MKIIGNNLQERKEQSGKYQQAIMRLPDERGSSRPREYNGGKRRERHEEPFWLEKRQEQERQEKADEHFQILKREDMRGEPPRGFTGRIKFRQPLVIDAVLVAVRRGKRGNYFL